MKYQHFYLQTILYGILLLSSCNTSPVNNEKSIPDRRIHIIIDTDANNELDDQHALAYAFCNADIFNIEGITVNNTKVGNGIEGHYLEALRIAKLCRADSSVGIYRGATGNYMQIKDSLDNENYDGKDAVEFIIKKAMEPGDKKLVLIPIGKLTNIALALEKEPTIKDRIRVVWLGSNFPDPGEYNLENDPESVDPVIRSGVEFEIALVAYDRLDGTTAVTVPIAEIERRMPGLGPHIETAVEGRNGGYYYCFGDYAVNLWQNMELYGDQKVRSLFDLAAVAIVKNPAWCENELIRGYTLVEGIWTESSDTSCKFLLHKNFKRDSIISDLYSSLTDFVLVE